MVTRGILRHYGLCWLLMAVVAWAAPGRARAGPSELERQAEQTYDAAESLATSRPVDAASGCIAAGRLFLAAAETRPGREATTLRWYAFKAFMRAHQLDPNQAIAPAMAREICKTVVGIEGAAVDPRFAERCAALEPVDRPAVIAPSRRPVPPPPIPVARRPGTRNERVMPARRRMAIVTWSAVALTGMMGAVALGTGLARVRAPFHGAAYRDIHDTAVASQRDGLAGNDVGTSAEDSMCAQARMAGSAGPRNPAVARACDRHDALGTTSVATGALAAVFLVPSVVLVALLARRSRGAAPMRGRRAQLGVSRMSGGGVMFAGSFAF